MAIDFRNGGARVEAESGPSPFTYRFDRWLPPILEGESAWEDFLLSLRFGPGASLTATTTTCSGSSSSPSRRARRRWSVRAPPAPDDRIEVRPEGHLTGVSAIARMPGTTSSRPAGAPDGTLRCLAHHYEFDLVTGESAMASSAPLSVERARLSQPWQGRGHDGTRTRDLQRVMLAL